MEPPRSGRSEFPAGFVWGAASSAYQVEGGAHADGKGESIWDVRCRTPGAVYGGHTGDVACDHYHRYGEDVGLMRRIGLRAYRFSISWARVMPEGRGGAGAVNPGGLGFYDRLVDALLGAGITPWVTLFHWDLPQALMARGGWLERESAEWFADYAAVLVDRLSDRVEHWITVNEPQIFLGPSHGEPFLGTTAAVSVAEKLLAAHHVLMAHGRACAVIRSRTRKTARVGWAPIGRVKVPASDSGADLDAARRATHAVLAKDFWNNAWFADPVVFGHYPEDGLRLFGDDLRGAGGGETRRALESPADLATIRQPLDFYGINVYDAERYRAGTDGPERVAYPPGHPQTAIRWFMDENALYYGPLFLHERYRLPIVVTENGMSNVDWVGLDGRCRDPQRIDYTRRYLRALRRAIGAGADVRGYFHWSILDNFEWAQGYKERFGLIHVDYATQRRTVKDSARWYRRVIETNGAALEDEEGL